MKKIKKYSATERQELKSDLKKRLELEPYNWLEHILKDKYAWERDIIKNFLMCLLRLRIPLEHGDYDDYYYFDMDDFVEKLIPAPKGYEWCGSRIRKI